MPNSESMPGISIPPFKYLHRESRDGPTPAEELSARRGKSPFPQHFPGLILTSRHDQHPAKPGISRGQQERAPSGLKSWNKAMEGAAGHLSAVTHCCNISGQLIRQRAKGSQLRGAALWERSRRWGSDGDSEGWSRVPLFLAFAQMEIQRPLLTNQCTCALCAFVSAGRHRGG